MAAAQVRVQQLQQVFADDFKAMGGKILVAGSDRANRRRHASGAGTASASEKPRRRCYFPVFTAAATRKSCASAKETPGLEKTKLMGGGSLLSADFIQAAGPGSRSASSSAIPTCRRRAMGKNYPKFVEAYKKAYGEAPISGYSRQRL